MSSEESIKDEVLTQLGDQIKAVSKPIIEFLDESTLLK